MTDQAQFKRIGEILIESGIITQLQLNEALNEQDSHAWSDKKIGQILVSMGYIAKDHIYDALVIQNPEAAQITDEDIAKNDRNAEERHQKDLARYEASRQKAEECQKYLDDLKDKLLVVDETKQELVDQRIDEFEAAVHTGIEYSPSMGDDELLTEENLGIQKEGNDQFRRLN